MKKILIIVGVIVLLIIVGLFVYIKIVPNNFPCWPPFCMPGRPIPDTKSNDSLTSWKTYTNTQYGFEFKYPSTFYIRSEGLVSQDNTYIISFDIEELRNTERFRIFQTVEYRINSKIDSIEKIYGHFGDYCLVEDKILVNKNPESYKLICKYYNNQDEVILDKNNQSVSHNIFVAIKDKDLILFDNGIFDTDLTNTNTNLSFSTLKFTK